MVYIGEVQSLTLLYWFWVRRKRCKCFSVFCIYSDAGVELVRSKQLPKENDYRRWIDVCACVIIQLWKQTPKFCKKTTKRPQGVFVWDSASLFTTITYFVPLIIILWIGTWSWNRVGWCTGVTLCCDLAWNAQEQCNKTSFQVLRWDW